MVLDVAQSPEQGEIAGAGTDEALDPTSLLDPGSPATLSGDDESPTASHISFAHDTNFDCSRSETFRCAPRPSPVPSASPDSPSSFLDLIADPGDVTREDPDVTRHRSEAEARDLDLSSCARDGTSAAACCSGPSLDSSNVSASSSSAHHVDDAGPTDPFSQCPDLFTDWLNIDSLDNETWDSNQSLYSFAHDEISPALVVRCPVCLATVARAPPAAATSREQMDFCVQPKRADAQREWDRRGLPTIDWDFLEARLATHLPPIRRILMRESASPFRDRIVAAAMASPLAYRKASRQGLAHASVGYYGPRGMQIMYEIPILLSLLHKDLFADTNNNHRGEYVAMELHADLNPHHDPLLLTVGIRDYILAILVPKMATLLIAQDLKISVEAARAILDETEELGNKLHAED